jgi:Mu-like prophage FluMu N-terminal domain
MAKTIRITARPPRGIRRAGVHHPASTVDHPDDRFTEDQLKKLQLDPDLIVDVVDVTEGEAEGRKGDAGKASTGGKKD